MRMNKGNAFMDVVSETGDSPTFSWQFLAEESRINKYDVRFIMGVAEEYEHVIAALGPEATRALLQVKPRLVQRLGTGQVVVDHLEDARSESDIYHDKSHPPQVILDTEAANNVLHNKYESLYNPEADMERRSLRAYNTLTETLGKDAIKRRQEAIDKLPQKLARQAKVKTDIAEGRRGAKAERAAREAIISALKGETDKDEAIEQYEKVYGKS